MANHTSVPHMRNAHFFQLLQRRSCYVVEFGASIIIYCPEFLICFVLIRKKTSKNLIDIYYRLHIQLYFVQKYVFFPFFLHGATII